MCAAVQSSALRSIGARPCASGGLAAERSRRRRWSCCRHQGGLQWRVAQSAQIQVASTL